MGNSTKMPVWRRALMGAIGSAAIAGGIWVLVEQLLFAEVVRGIVLLGAGMLLAAGGIGIRDLFRG